MKKLMILLSAMFLLMSLVAITGCGGDNAAEETEAIQVVTYDCDGGCGMKDMPANQTVTIEGKFYCAGCADKVKDKGDEASGHEGHNH